MTSPKKKKLGRIALRVAVALLVFLTLVTAGASLALHRILVTGKLKEWANGNPEKLTLEYSSASGWLPWDVRVRDLELRGRDPNVEWYARIDEVRAGIAPFSLLRHKLRFTHAHGTGLTFRLRVRVAPGEASAQGEKAHFDALPEIPGFPKRPLRDEREEESSSGGGRPLRISVADLDVQGVREIWIDIWRLVGSGQGGSVVGSFNIFPHERASVGPARVEVPGARFSVGSQAIAGEVSFATDATIRPFDPRTVKGDDVWPYISGHVSLSGRLAGLDFLNHFLRTSSEPRLSGGTGTLAARIEFVDGKGHGTMNLDAARASVRYQDARITSDVAVRMRVPVWDMQHDRLDISGTRVSLEHAAAAAPGPDSRDWWGRFDLASADIRSGRADVFQATITARCRDARPLFTLFEVALPGWARGVLELEGLDARSKIGLGKGGRADVAGLEASGGAFRILGDYRTRGTPASKEGGFLLETGALTLGLEIDGGSSRLKLTGARKWFENRRRPESVTARK